MINAELSLQDLLQNSSSSGMTHNKTLSEITFLVFKLENQSLLEDNYSLVSLRRKCFFKTSLNLLVLLPYKMSNKS